MRMYCRRCYEGLDAWIPPKQCPACGKATTTLDWLINLPQDRPKSAWEVTDIDRRILGTLNITAD